MKFILRYIKPYTVAVLIGMLIKFTGTIADLVLPSILAHLIDVVAPSKNVGSIIAFGALMLFFAVIGFSFNVVANRMASKVARDSCEKIRHDLFKKTQELSCRKTDEVTIASLEARLTSDTYNLHNFIGRIQRIGVRAPILLVGGMAVTLFLDTSLALVLICTLPFISFVVYFVSKRGVRLYKMLQESVDAMVRVVRENSLGIRVIKALSKTDYETERFDKVNTEASKRDRKANLVMGASNPIISLLLNIGLCAVILVGAVRVDGGLCEPGKIIAFMTYFTMISNAMLSVTRVFMMTSKGVASADRIAQIVDTTDGVDKLFEEQKSLDAKEPEEAVSKDVCIEFRNVSFSYVKGKKTLENISFSLGRGQTVGIIGETGSGKTTILSLLMRFYEPDSGEIFLDGKKLGTYSKTDLRSRFGIAMQNDFLFEGSIEENITFGRSVTEEGLEKALETSQAKEFVSELDDKTDHLLTSKGTNLSGGQKQRLLIARALAADPEILILDDSSSALDYRTDAFLRSAIKASYGGRITQVVVAQRVSAVKNADLILVLEKGCVIGKGTHDELMQSCKDYKEIAKSQMGSLE